MFCLDSDLGQDAIKRPKWGSPEPLEAPKLSDPAETEQDMAEYRRKWFELKGKHLEVLVLLIST